MMLLDSVFAPLTPLKIGMALPSLLAYALISYISYTFLFKFLPFALADQQFSFGALLVQMIFIYFSSMTYIHLTRAFLANPGYLPKWLKVPMNINGEAPTDIVRIYNMRFWMANKIYMFDEFIKPEQDGAEDSNIEISLSTESELNSPTIANNTIIE